MDGNNEVDMTRHLQETYGFDSFRDGQKEIIDLLSDGADIFCHLPTSFGKTLLYQFLSTFYDDITVVVSPLLALIRDQVASAHAKGISAIHLTSNTAVDLGKFHLVYTTPETLQNVFPLLENFRERIGRLAVDESHCISQWGHDFRPAFQKIQTFRQCFPGVPIIALTATSIQETREEIMKSLGLIDPIQYMDLTHRPNLHIKCREVKSLMDSCHYPVDKEDGQNVIFTMSRKKTEEISHMLQTRGSKCDFFHASMSDSEKERKYTGFASGDIRTMVATTAFAMGVDLPCLNHVVVAGLPNDIETYYQEIGRAGRNGQDSVVELIYESQCLNRRRWAIRNGCTDPVLQRYKLARLEQLEDYTESVDQCRNVMLTNYFACGKLDPLPGEYDEDLGDPPQPCEKCDNCIRTDDDLVDITNETKALVDVLHTLDRPMSVADITAVLQGKKTKTTRQFSVLVQYGCAKNIPKTQWNRILKKLGEMGVVRPVGTHYVHVSGRMLAPHAKFQMPKSACLSNKPTTKTPNALSKVRDAIASEEKISPQSLLSDKTLCQIEKVKTIEELSLVDGIDPEFIIKYASRFLSHNNTTVAPKKTRVDKRIAFQMFVVEGKTIDQISKELEYTHGTIENHIAAVVGETSDFDYNIVSLTPETITQIQKYYKLFNQKKKPIKEIMPSLSYFQIKIGISATIVPNE